jgi:hypothetical protein
LVEVRPGDGARTLLDQEGHRVQRIVGRRLLVRRQGVAVGADIGGVPAGRTANRCDLPTAFAFAGLLVAAVGALVKFYKSKAAPASSPVVSMQVLPAAPSNVVQEPQFAA